MTEMVTISFEGSITLPVEELDAALGDAAQAVQDAIGRTGAFVVSADADHIDDDDLLADPDPPAVVSWNALVERELASGALDEADELASERRFREDPW